jgi:hypothetical protein
MLASGVVLAQESKTVISPAKANSATTNSSRTNPEDPQVLRKQQLLIFQEYILTRTLDNIKNMDEPALRLSTRNDILTYLSRDKTTYEQNRALATKVALDALADFSGHSEEISRFIADYLLGDLGAWIQKYEPELIDKFRAAEKTKGIGKEPDRIRSLLELKDGDALAASRIRQLLQAGQDVDGLIFYLDELMKRNSKEFELLLSEIVAVAERGANPSLETLYWVSQIYFSPQISKTIKQRFLSMVITRTQPANFIVEAPSKVAYDLLTQVLPAIRELIPELYGQALTQSFALRASFNERQLASEARAKRLRESLNPIADLVAEAEAAKSKGERNELLAGAAQWALRDKKLSLCLDIVAKLDLDVATASPEFWRGWTGQFLKDFVKSALATQDTELAEKGAGRIVSPLARVEGLVLIMRYSGKANDKTTAQRLLAEARKIADASSDNAEKAKAFFLLSITCDIADESQRAELLESGIRVLNNLFKPASIGNEKEAYQEYVRSLDNAGNELRKSFKGLTRKDENGAIALAERLRKPDLKAFAMIGILQGLDDLITAAKK